MTLRDAASHENDTSGPFHTKNTGTAATSLQRIEKCSIQTPHYTR